MVEETCRACGATFSGDDRKAVTKAAVEHFTEVHPDWRLTETAIVNWVDAKERLSGQVERLDEVGEVEVHPVTRDRVEDTLSFFDHDGFAGNPEWASCYCMFFHRENPDENGNQPWRENREALRSRLEAGTTVGYLAYVDGRPAGWCNASLRSAYPTRTTGEGDDEVGVVTCFVIAPPYRRHGLAKRLLEAAIEGFEARGVKRVEGHPAIEDRGDAGSFQGPLPLYLNAGFKEVTRDQDHALVAKELA